MTSKTRMILIVSSSAALLSYPIIYERLRNEHLLIHRLTWGWSGCSHKITLGYWPTKIQPLPFAPLHIPGDDSYNSAMEDYIREERMNRIMQEAINLIFTPLRWLEVVAWNMYFPDDYRE